MKARVLLQERTESQHEAFFTADYKFVGFAVFRQLKKIQPIFFALVIHYIIQAAKHWIKILARTGSFRDGHL